MAARLSPEEVDELIAADVLDPLDDSWQQAATIAASVCNMLAAILDRITELGGGTTKEREALDPQDFIPAPAFLREIQARSKRAAMRANDMSVEELRARAKKQYGGK